jgi:hypothetical protein
MHPSSMSCAFLNPVTSGACPFPSFASSCHHCVTGFMLNEGSFAARIFSCVCSKSQSHTTWLLGSGSLCFLAIKSSPPPTFLTALFAMVLCASAIRSVTVRSVADSKRRERTTSQRCRCARESIFFRKRQRLVIPRRYARFPNSTRIESEG